MNVKVPGKILLAGEYAVLNGAQALACTVDKYLDVAVRFQESLRGLIRVESEMWSQSTNVGAETTSTEPLIDAVSYCARHYDLDDAVVHVTSELDPKYGIGSSSAVALGAIAGLAKFADVKLSSKQLLPLTVGLQRSRQGQASGYDFYTQWTGGVVSYKMPVNNEYPKFLESNKSESALNRLNQVVRIFVGGLGAPTALTTKETQSWLASRANSGEFTAASENLVSAFKKVIEGEGSHSESFDNLIGAVNLHRSHFRASPLFPKIADFIEGLPQFGPRLTYKTTGAGGEDAILGIGDELALESLEASLSKRGWHRLDAKFSGHGIKITGGPQ